MVKVVNVVYVDLCIALLEQRSYTEIDVHYIVDLYHVHDLLFSYWGCGQVFL